MLGNVAIARGLLEAGVQFVASYPGTPSSEITEALAEAARRLGGRPYVEWSVNEKVALEAALGAAAAGARAVTAMKHVGLNVAADPLFSSAYVGVEGALLVISADDPWMWSSQNEQDNRWYGIHAYVPVVEPTGAQDAKEAAYHALLLSEKYKRPVLLRTTTRVSHTRVPVNTGKIDVSRLEPVGAFKKDPPRWTVVPAYSRRHRIELLEVWDKLSYDLAGFPLNSVEGSGDVAIVGAGVGYRYAKEAVSVLGIEDRVTIYKLATPVPLPLPIAEKILVHDVVLVVEEGDPVVETMLRSYANRLGSRARIFGKGGGDVPMKSYGELDLSEVVLSVAKLADVEPPRWAVEGRQERGPSLALPARPPVMCPGCPYRSFFYALKRSMNKLGLKPIYSGDIGCYSLGVFPPFEVQDIMTNMGSSIGAGHGLAKVTSKSGQFVVAIIGDSTFFHSGLPALANAVYNRSPMLVAVLDNRTTAMTGHQPHPGIGMGALGATRELAIEEVARGLGVSKVVVADSFDIRDSEAKLLDAAKHVLEKREPAVVVARGSCMLVALREASRVGVKPPKYFVDEAKCTGCGVCYKAFNCPAIYRRDDGKAAIDPALCTGCGECAQVCPFGAFKVEGEQPEEWAKIMRTAKPLPR
jgi:indolepyruvate ferredoxin oxidoreductase alpha subunit